MTNDQIPKKAQEPMPQKLRARLCVASLGIGHSLVIGSLVTGHCHRLFTVLINNSGPIASPSNTRHNAFTCALCP